MRPLPGALCATFLAALMQAAAPLPVLPPPIPCDPHNVYFDAGSATLDAKSAAAILAVAQDALQKRLAAGVEGHADSAESNPDGLAARRAGAVAAELTRDGMMTRDVSTMALGDNDPAVPDPRTDAEQAQNRRVAINICTG
ncbi:MAG: OmpA family protein [Rhizomicrobium sp.]